jgi:hypothetical protein
MDKKLESRILRFMNSLSEARGTLQGLLRECNEIFTELKKHDVEVTTKIDQLEDELFEEATGRRRKETTP